MARIRSIHPDFPSDKKLARVPRDARLAFVCCWCIADDAGLFRAEPRQLLGALFPHDHDVADSQLEVWLADLVRIGVLRWRQTRDGARVGQVVNWQRQKIDKPSKSFLSGELLPLDIDSRGTSEAVATPSLAPREDVSGGVLSLEPRVLSPEPRAVEPDALLRERLPSAYHEALEGYLRSAPYPVAVVQAILAEGPDTGINGSAGKTWDHIGKALLELRAAGEGFRPVLFRAYVRRLVTADQQGDVGPSGAPLTDAEKMRRAADVERRREQETAR